MIRNNHGTSATKTAMSVLSDKLQDALNKQINSEIYSAYFYLSVAAYFESLDLKGFSHWMRLQHDEEMRHALRIFDFINDCRSRVILQAIAQPPVDFASPLRVAEEALKHEREVTASIDNLYRLAQTENDPRAQIMLEWFINEQIEEEKSADHIIRQLELIGEDGTGLLLLDQQLGLRVARQ